MKSIITNHHPTRHHSANIDPFNIVSTIQPLHHYFSHAGTLLSVRLSLALTHHHWHHFRHCVSHHYQNISSNFSPAYSTCEHLTTWLLSYSPHFDLHSYQIYSMQVSMHRCALWYSEAYSLDAYHSPTYSLGGSTVAVGLKPSANTSQQSPATVAQLLCVNRPSIAHTYHTMCKHHLSYCACFCINVLCLTLSSVVVQSSCKVHTTFTLRQSTSLFYNYIRIDG